MQLETVSAWATIVGTVLAFIGFIFGVWLEWPKIKERIVGNPQYPRKMSPILSKLTLLVVLVGILIATFGLNLAERLKSFAPSFPLAQNTDIRLEAKHPGIADAELISITNASTNQLSLYGWSVSKNGQHLYSFSQQYIKPGQVIDLHTRSGVDSTTSFHMQYYNSILQSGDVITLIDGAGESKAEYKIP